MSKRDSQEYIRESFILNTGKGNNAPDPKEIVKQTDAIKNSYKENSDSNNKGSNK